MRTYLITLRNAARGLMHAGIRRAASPADATREYLDSLSAPFSDYQLGAGSSLQDQHNWQWPVAFGPFTCIATAEHMTAAAEPQDDDPAR